MTTFGFEAEFTSGADRLINLLTERGYAQQPEERLHAYHCDCTNCHDLLGVPFRAQRDSSCGGEVISGIFNDGDWEHATECMYAFQEAALDVDATIDERCAIHVHIGNSDGDDLAIPNILSMSWLGVEPLLWEHVATGAWARRRSSFNALVSTAVLDQVANSGVWGRHELYPMEERQLDATSSEFQRAYIAEFRNQLTRMRWDRHADLATATHGGIYEMRIFNATRVAWRIELACRLSVALADPTVAEHFATQTEEWLFDGRASLGTRMGQLRNGFRRSGRQYSAREERPLLQSLPISLDDFIATMRDFDEQLGDLLVKQTGYTASRKQIGVMRGAIGNTLDMSGWNHDQVLAALNPTHGPS